MLLIIVQGIKCIRLFKRYKAEQNAELQEERDKIEAERAENAKKYPPVLRGDNFYLGELYY